MTATYYILISGIVVGIIIGRAWAKGRGGLSAAHEAVAKRKEESKARILKMFTAENSEITNDDVQKLLGVSDATATNYLSELEVSGDITQVGTTGQSVHYHKQH